MKMDSVPDVMDFWSAENAQLSHYCSPAVEDRARVMVLTAMPTISYITIVFIVNGQT